MQTRRYKEGFFWWIGKENVVVEKEKSEVKEIQNKNKITVNNANEKNEHKRERESGRWICWRERAKRRKRHTIWVESRSKRRDKTRIIQYAAKITNM